MKENGEKEGETPEKELDVEGSPGNERIQTE